MKATGIEKKYSGKFLSLYEISYTNNEHDRYNYEMVSKAGTLHGHLPDLTLDTIANHPNAIVLVVFNSDHTKMLLSKEFRMGVNSYVYNNIAGLIEPTESEEAAAKRELFEETGLVLTKIIAKLNPTFTCAPVTDDITTLIICEASEEIRGSNSPNEEIHSKWVTKEEMKHYLNNSKELFAGRTQAFAYSWVYGI